MWTSRTDARVALSDAATLHPMDVDPFALVEYDHHDGDRYWWRWTIGVVHTEADDYRRAILAEGADLSTPRGPSTDDGAAMMRTLGSFLGAYAEAVDRPGSENGSLFPEDVAPYAADLADTITVLLPDEE